MYYFTKSSGIVINNATAEGKYRYRKNEIEMMIVLIGGQIYRVA